MLGKKAKYRIFYLLILFISFASILFFIFASLEENVVYFFSPTDIKKKTEILPDEKIRIGGLVKVGSINKENMTISFIITDLKNEIIVSYNGSVPNLFSEGKGVIAEGKLEDKGFFVADSILAKHDENYMPPEVKKALEN